MTNSSDNTPGNNEESPSETSPEDNIHQSPENKLQSYGEGTNEQTNAELKETIKTIEHRFEDLKEQFTKQQKTLEAIERVFNQTQYNNEYSAKSDAASSLQQLNNIPFESLIGGPLSAAIKAQGIAARETSDFLQKVGMDEKQNVRMVEFKYESVGDDGKPKDSTLKVPLLTLLPIPFLRIDDMRIEFTAKLSSSQSTILETEKNENASFNASVGYWYTKVSFQGGISNKNKTTSNSEYSVDYTMNVSVHAVQDRIPSGLENVMNILLESITKNNTDKK